MLEIAGNAGTLELRQRERRSELMAIPGRDHARAGPGAQREHEELLRVPEPEHTWEACIFYVTLSFSASST